MNAELPSHRRGWCAKSDSHGSAVTGSERGASKFKNLKICYRKIDVSCEASVNFSQNATPATEFAPCRHNAIRKKTIKNTQHDSSKVLRLLRKMTMEVANALRLPRKLELIS
jgi:hypothetical protein